ncbi:hypothetical protein EJ110_NYTH28861 [Nymphaea thermarum]|nr:hypothetical protein EJ110_NYTH28861 [Nymphaea thermarum]
MACAYEWMAPPVVQHPAYPCKPLSLVQRPPTRDPVSLVQRSPTSDPVCCNACSFPITGFRYNYCSYNLHPYCAGISPHLYIQHPHGPPHLATLMFFPPYLSGQFTCDICKKLGGSHWLYRCTVCDDFDAHLGCAINAAQLQFRLHPAQYCPPMTPVDGPYNSGGGGGGTAYASPPSSDPWKKIGKCMWAALRLSDLAFGTGGLINLGSSLFDTMDHLLGDS